MSKKPSQLRRSAEWMYPLMARYEDGDQTQAEFCEHVDLNQGVFQYWLKKYRDQASGASAATFSKIEILSSDDVDNRIIIRTRGGVEIEIPIN